MAIVKRESRKYLDSFNGFLPIFSVLNQTKSFLFCCKEDSLQQKFTNFKPLHDVEANIVLFIVFNHLLRWISYTRIDKWNALFVISLLGYSILET